MVVAVAEAPVAARRMRSEEVATPARRRRWSLIVVLVWVSQRRRFEELSRNDGWDNDHDGGVVDAVGRGCSSSRERALAKRGKVEFETLVYRIRVIRLFLVVGSVAMFCFEGARGRGQTRAE